MKRPQLTDRQCRMFLKDAREFGYSNLTFEEVRELADQIYNGDKMTDVVGILLERQIDEALEMATKRRP